jgi:phosphatidate phosphatase APP1
MGGLMDRLQAVFDRIAGKGEAIHARFQRMFGRDDPLKMLPYLGYGTATQIFVNGRVLEEEGIVPAGEEETLVQHLLRMYHAWETDEVPGAHVRLRFGEVVHDAVTDAEGYFSGQCRPAGPLPEQLWHPVALELLDPQPAPGTPIRATGQVLVPPQSARFGVISDIDDTIIQSHIGNPLKMVLTVALRNARTRVPFAGVAAFYHALQQGATGNEHNPIFYVSKSSWNLYDLLLEFLDIHGIPVGPLFLRDFGLHLAFSRQEQQDYKLRKITPLLDLYDPLPFILIGDSGEQDPEIYTEVVRCYPKRIRAVYIRTVSPDPQRIAAIQTLATAISSTGCQLILAPDSATVAAHAAGEGWIAPDALVPIQARAEADHHTPAQQEVLGA